MIKAIIVDDEYQVRLDIKKKVLSNFNDAIVIVAEADSVSSGLEVIAQHQPELIFLDIHLGDGSGFDLLTKTPHREFDVIFITGFDNHALKAIKVGALDYILKPVDEEELKTAVEKAIKNNTKENHLEKLIEVSSEYFKGVEKKRVILKTADDVYAIYEDDILYCKSDSNYTTIYTQNLERIVISKTLKKIQEILTDSSFVRCHQSYVVNKKHVVKYNRNGVLIVHMDVKIPVSSRRKDYALKKLFG